MVRPCSLLRPAGYEGQAPQALRRAIACSGQKPATAKHGNSSLLRHSAGQIQMGGLILLFREVSGLYPVEVQYEMYSNKGEQYFSAVFVKELKGPQRDFRDKHCGEGLVYKQHEQDRIQDFKSRVSFHNRFPSR